MHSYWKLSEYGKGQSSWITFTLSAFRFRSQFSFPLNFCTVIRIVNTWGTKRVLCFLLLMISLCISLLCAIVYYCRTYICYIHTCPISEMQNTRESRKIPRRDLRCVRTALHTDHIWPCCHSHFYKRGLLPPLCIHPHASSIRNGPRNS
jgi:hypothetical protein